MLLLLEINFLHLILPVALLLAGWPPPLPRTHPFHRGEGGWCYDHDHGRGGGGGDPEPGTYIYIHISIYVHVQFSLTPPAGPFTPNCHSPPDVAISKVAAPSGKSDPPWSTPGASHAAQVRQSVLYHYHQQGQHGPFMVQFLFISSMMCWSWKGWFMIFCHPFLKDIWIQLKFLVSKLTYLYLGTTKKRRNLSTLGSGCKKKVPLYVAPWRCRNVVLRS